MDYSKLTKDQIIESIKNNEIAFMSLSFDLKDDKEVTLVAIKKNVVDFYYASDRLRDDEDVVLETVRKNGMLLMYVSERLKDDKNIVLAAIKKNVISLVHASERLQDDTELLKKLEKFSPKVFYSNKVSRWYKERMEFLDNIRNQKEKELMENFIFSSNNKSKKVKF